MKISGAMTGVALAALTAGAGLLALSQAQATASAAESASAMKVDDFMLPDQEFLAHQLYHMTDTKAVVLVTYDSRSKAVAGDAAAIGALRTAYAKKNVEVFGLDSSPGESRAAVKASLASAKLDLPVLMDSQQLVGEQLGVTRADEVIVINPRTWKVAYRGPIADGGQELAAQAIDALRAGAVVTVAQRQAKGELISFPARQQQPQFEKISYAHTIAPIIQQKCAACHEPGGIGPMPLTSYEQIKGFSPMIREVLRTKRMPPYGADPEVGHFQDDKRLSPDQIKTLVHWIEAGSPRGEGADPLKQIAFQAPAWPLGKPDMVIDVPSYDIPAKGIVDYQRPYVANTLTEAKWLKASTIKVADRQAVHHVLSGIIKPEDAPMPGEKQEAPESKWGASIGGYAVGSESEVAPHDYGTYMPTGGGFGFQNHYTPYGKATTEKTQVALYFYKNGEVPKYVMHNIAIADPSITIGPNEEFHKEMAYLPVPKDMILFGAFPHAHYRGGSSTFSVMYPDGHEVMLLALPKYDFNWQREYTFATPLKVPAGSKLIARFTYDNTARNPANPDPNRTVPWGDQSFDEMLYNKIRYAWADETSAHMKPENDVLFNQGRLLGMFDDNMDGKIELSELKGAPGMGLKKNFALLDRNKDGSLDVAELKAAMAMMPDRRRTASAPAAQPAAKPTASVEAKPAAKPITTASR